MTSSKHDNIGVFELLTQLCNKTASFYSSQSRISHKRLVSKMRSYSYELILRRSNMGLSSSTNEPISELLSQCFVAHSNIKNVADYKKYVELKGIISSVRQTDFGDNKENVNNVLKVLVGLSNTVKEDMSAEIHKNPFSFGLLDQMLPKPQREVFGSPQPYSFYPSHVFDLPYALKREASLMSGSSQTYPEYTVENFDSRALLNKDTQSHIRRGSEENTFISPMSLPSMSSHVQNSDSGLFNYPRLMEPRDLLIPSSHSTAANTEVKPSVGTNNNIKEVFRAKTQENIDIWELASQVDRDIPDDIWELVSKMPPVKERQLIATSSREMALWQHKYCNVISKMSVISEKQFIRHVMYLIIGVETNSFPFSRESNCFYLKENLLLEGISKELLDGYISDLLLIGTCYKRLYNFAFNKSLEDHVHNCGLVYEASRDVIRRYLLEFRLKATEMYEECSERGNTELNCMPTLLQILHHMEPLKYEIEIISSVYKVMEGECRASIPTGADLMSYLFDEISSITHKQTSCTMFSALYSVCKVYFKFIERFIFEGELDDRYGEFFIRKDVNFVSCKSKLYWDKGFHAAHSVAVPLFLQTLAKCILQCGKSLRLLKLCNPTDPLVLLISSDHPSVKCCASFAQLERQQRVLDVYRTRCLFVSGEPVTLEQILLKRDAERKAFAEMATLKQQDTMEKIVAERKRLAQLIIAEKQHSLRVLEAAMEEAKAAKSRSRKRAKLMTKLEEEADRATEEVDSMLRTQESNKIMEYYSKLNMEVEKSKMHTEWKIKRLQLDQSRMQLLSTEERNLKREKLELEHQRSEDMAMSIRSDFGLDDKYEDNVGETSSEEIIKLIHTDSETSESETNKAKAKTSDDDVFSAISNVPKSNERSVAFASSNEGDENCDNKKYVDSQGNVITKIITIVKAESKTSSEVIGGDLDNKYDNEQFLKMRNEAMINKQKVMAHKFGLVDEQNNTNKPFISLQLVDEENNLPSTPFVEARRNKLRILGAECELPNPEKQLPIEPKNEAQKAALINRQKVMGVEYNIPLPSIVRKDPLNFAQESALINRNKVLGSDYGDSLSELSKRREPAKRSGLTLNLKPYVHPVDSSSLGVTPNNGAITPAEFFSRLDLETPTTADIPLEGQMTSDAYSPKNEDNQDKSMQGKTDKEFLTSDGFNFSFIVDEDNVDSEVNGMQAGDNHGMASSKLPDSTKKKSLFNILDGSYSLDEFDPFGMKEFKTYSKEHFESKMNLDMTQSCYTHPAITMQEVQKKPYANIFASHFESQEDEAERITCDNIATLTACLQRSVMLPLTYQLEVVNNSILTYFLVNLDMYEHLRSLKDYFFLMDGEFSRSICHNLFKKLAKTINPQELLNYATLHNILDKALGSSISHIHKFSENLSFTISDPPLSFQHSSGDVLQCLSLTYSVGWPLNIILSQEALMRYSKIFQFLVKLRRISWVLGEDFECLKLTTKQTRRNSRLLLRSPQYRSIQLYRHIMASFVRALDNYIVTTCILGSWSEFESELQKARTLDDLYQCHVGYIKMVLFRCLLNKRSTPVMKLLNDIFTVVLKFSRVLKAGEWHQADSSTSFTHQNYPQLAELFHMFEKLAKYVHKVIIRLMECGYQRHLAELLTMINLNGHYDPERTKEEHSSIQTP